MAERIFVNKGFVALIDSKATDLSVINSARVSFGKRQEELKAGDEGLINFLLSNRHGTPFEHNFFQFHVKCPIFVAREWFRHRIGSFNEISMRYSQPEIEFFIPGLRSENLVLIVLNLMRIKKNSLSG